MKSGWMRRLGVQRIESLVLALMISLPVGYLALGDTLAWAGEHEHEEEREGGKENRVAAVTPKQTAADTAAAAAMKEECSACHIAFPAKRLPAASWQKLMANLGDHFGTDASIDDATLAKTITDHLVKNAGDPAKYSSSKGVPLRITETSWFIREHDEVRAAAWKRPSIKSAANCAACHQGAANGDYSERNIRIPKQ